MSRPRSGLLAAMTVALALLVAACSGAGGTRTEVGAGSTTSSAPASTAGAGALPAPAGQTTSTMAEAPVTSVPVEAPPTVPPPVPPSANGRPPAPPDQPADPPAGPALPTSGPRPKAVLTATGVVVPVLGREAGALVVGTPCGNSTQITTGTPIDGVVVLDAGHGGVEPGAVGPNGLTEKELNLAVTMAARDALEAAGVAVVLTRTGDYRATLDARAGIVSAIKPRAFVSIHHNAEPDGPRAGPGVETYYQTVGSTTAQSKRLAGLIYEEVVAALEQYRDVTWVADSDAGAKYRKGGSGNDYYAMVRTTQGTPGVLAELGFISNAPEAELYARPDVQRVEGQAVARAVVRFLTTDDPGSGFVEPYPRQQPAGGGGGASNCRDPQIG